jgi:predicted dehydrogenase
MKDIKVAIIGAGSAARLHLQAYRKCSQVEVTAVCGTNPDRVDAFAAEFGVRAYLSIEHMLRQERPDLVSITTLEWDHERPVMLSLEAGCHVLCEKVMAHTLAIGERMVAAARRAGRTLGVNYNYRAVPSHALIKQELARGGFGEPALFAANMHSYLWAHLLDLSRYFFGDPVAVTATMVDDQSRRPRVTDNTAQPWMHADEMIYHPSVALAASFRYSRPEFIATLSGSALVPIAEYYWSFALFGSAGALSVSAANRDNLGGEPRLGRVAELLRALEPFSYPQSFDLSVMAFVDALLRGQPAPVTGEDGLAAMRLDAAIAASARSARTVILNRDLTLAAEQP